jgi:glycerophosphoryl diester phosphodiesterase
MKIISHRGFWVKPDEKNSEFAFERSFSLGFGVETDIRDSNQELVVSHDMPAGGELALERLLERAVSVIGHEHLTLALNIKSDGLSQTLSNILAKFSGLDCFVFDMAIPDMRGYFEVGIPVFTRLSEYETAPVWLERSAGVWLDAFDSEWYTSGLIDDFRNLNKRVCIVSPELHGRPHQALWQILKPYSTDGMISLCTDFPTEAGVFFSASSFQK